MCYPYSPQDVALPSSRHAHINAAEAVETNKAVFSVGCEALCSARLPHESTQPPTTHRNTGNGERDAESWCKAREAQAN